MSKKVRNCTMCRKPVKKEGYDSHLLHLHSVVEIGGTLLTISRNVAIHDRETLTLEEKKYLVSLHKAEKLEASGESRQAAGITASIMREHPEDLATRYDIVKDIVLAGDFERARDLCSEGARIAKQRGYVEAGTGMVWNRPLDVESFEEVMWKIDVLEKYSGRRVPDRTEEDVIVACIERLQSASEKFAWEGGRSREDFEKEMRSVTGEEARLLVEKGDLSVPYLYRAMAAGDTPASLVPMILGDIGSEAAVNALVEGLLCDYVLINDECGHHLSLSGVRALPVLNGYLFEGLGPQNEGVSIKLKALILDAVEEMMFLDDVREEAIQLMTEVIRKSDELSIVSFAGRKLAALGDKSVLPAVMEALERTDDPELESEIVHLGIKSAGRGHAGGRPSTDPLEVEWTRGRCSLCGTEADVRSMSDHLLSCSRREPDGATVPPGEVRFFSLLMMGETGLSTYWLYAEAKASGTLSDLDNFIRETWVECCNHASEFAVEGKRFVSDHAHHSGCTCAGMDVKLDQVLSEGTILDYEYDYGSTTEIQILVAGEYGGNGNAEGNPVRLLARNVELSHVCADCGIASATKICTECVYGDEEPFLCESCSTGHECGEDRLLPLLNSPRTGVCGYTGIQQLQ